MINDHNVKKDTQKQRWFGQYATTQVTFKPIFVP